MKIRALTSVRLALASSALLLSATACQNVDIIWDSDLGALSSGESRLVFDVAPSSVNIAGIDFSTPPAVALKQGVIPDPTFTGTVRLSLFTDAECKVPSAVANTWTQTASSANLGVASFAAINLTAAGTYYLKATSGTYKSGCSPAFSVEAGSAVTLNYATSYSGSYGANIPFSPQPNLTVQDTYGNVAPTFDGIPVTLSAHTDSGCLTTAGGVLSGSPVNASAGKINFVSVSYNSMATIYIKAVAPGLPNLCSAAINITVPPTDHLAFTTGPAAIATAGSVIPGGVVIQAQDAINAVTSAFGAVVTLSPFSDATCSTPGVGALTSNTISASAGNATFASVTYDKSGPLYLKAVSGAFSSPCSPLINVVPGAVSVLTFTTPVSGTLTAGVAFSTQPILEVRDAYANVVTSYNTPVTLTSYTSGACSVTLGAISNNQVNAASGIVTYSNASFNQAPASVYVRAAGAGVASSCAGPFTSVAGPATQLVFTTAPSTTNTAGTNLATQPVLAARDSLNNVVASYATATTLNAFTDAICTTPAGSAVNAGVMSPAAGISNYTGVNYPGTGTLYFNATSGGLTSACTIATSFVAGTVTQLVFSQAPSSTNTAGVNFVTQPTVTARDTGGNLNTSYVTTMTISAFTDVGCLTSAGGVLSSNTRVPIAGISTFVGVNFSLAIPIYLRATAGGVASSCLGPLSTATGPATLLTFTTLPSNINTASVNFSTQPIVAVRDASANLVPSYSNPITLGAFTNAGCTTAAGALAGSAITPSGGVSTYTGVNYSLTGTIYIQAVSAGLSSPCTAALAVNPGPATQLFFSGQPSGTASAGVNFTVSPTVIAQDAASNTATAYATPVTLTPYADVGCTTSAAGSVTNGTQTTTSGVSAFANVSFNLASPIYLRATSGALASACSNLVNVMAGPVTQFVFSTAPSSTNTAGTVLATQPVVEARDAGGNVNLAYSNAITISAHSDVGCLTAGGGVLSGHVNSPVSGVATYSGLSYTGVGPIWIKVTSAGISSACTGSLFFNPGAATQLSFTVNPSTTNTVGVNLLTQPVVRAWDANNNVDASYSGAISLTAYKDVGCLTAGTGTLAYSAPNMGGSFTFTGVNYNASGPLYVKATATAPSINSACVSAGTVVAGPATHLGIQTSASSTATVGTAFGVQPVVRALDAFNNVATTYTTNVTVAAYAAPACGGGVAPGSFTSSPASTMTAGSSNYMTLTYSGPVQTMYLGFTAAGVTPVCDSNPISLGVGAPSKLVFLPAPGTASVGVPIAPVLRVQVQDVGSNLVPTASDSITIAVNSGGGTPSNTIQTAVSGVAEFPDLSVTTASIKVLRANSAALTVGYTTNITFVSSQPVKIAASAGSSCSVRANGATWCWGDNATYALGVGLGTVASYSSAVTYVPATSTQINLQLNSISSYGYAAHYCGVDATGKALCWGLNEDGQLGDGIKLSRGIPRYVLNSTGTAPLTTVNQVAVGGAFSCAIVGGTSVYCWGMNGDGQLGNSTYGSSSLPVAVVGLAGTINKIVAGERHACALNSAGNVYCWGNNVAGQIGDNSTTPRPTAVLVKDVPGTGVLSSVIDVSAGFDFTCAAAAGTAYCWGSNSYGELGMGTSGTDYSLPKQVKNTSNSGPIANVVKVSAGAGHSCFIAGTSPFYAYCAGFNGYGQLGLGTANFTPTPFPLQVSGLSNSSSATFHIAAGNNRTCAATSSQSFCWGNGATGGVGDGTFTGREAPAIVTGASSPTAIAVSLDAGCAITGGSVKCWGAYAAYYGPDIANAGQVPDLTGNGWGSANFVSGQNTTNGTPFFSLAAAGSVISGGADALGFATVTGGNLKSWGANPFGQLASYNGGAGDYVPGLFARPGNVAGMSLVRSSISARNGCAVDASNEIYCWGDNSAGQLGDGTTIDDIVPTLSVGGLPTMSDVSVSGQHTCGVTLSAGNVWCWGSGLNGTLGNGGTSGSSVPLQIPAFSGAKLIAAAPDHNCVAKNDGTVWCWGLNDSGQIGDGSMVPRYSPVQVQGVGGSGTLQNIVSVQVGIKHSCALDKFGFVYCWGKAASGVLGDGQTGVDRVYPVQVKDPGGAGVLGGIIGIASGGDHMCATTPSPGANSVFCWGAGGKGQLGDTTSVNRSLPVAVSGLP